MVGRTASWAPTGPTSYGRRGLPVGCCLAVPEELVQQAIGTTADEVPEDPVGVRVACTVRRTEGGDVTQLLVDGGTRAGRCPHEREAPAAARAGDRRPGRVDIRLVVTGVAVVVAGRGPAPSLTSVSCRRSACKA